MRNPEAYDEAEPAFLKIENESEGRTTPIAFLLEAGGICPRTFITKLSIEVLQAISWFEKGCLGLNFVDSPRWIVDAFNIVNSEINLASKLKREMEKSTKTPKSGRP